MTRQTDGKSLYEQQEERILAQSDAFISRRFYFTSDKARDPR